MQQGKHCKTAPRGGRRRVALVASLALVLVVAVGATIAYLTSKDAVTNTFVPGEVTTTVVEKKDGSVKSEVRIENTGNVDSWIRAKVVITWQDENGNVYGQLPVAGTDYTIEYNENEQVADSVEIEGETYSFGAGKWTKGADGFWYWSGRVAPGAVTGCLIAKCQPVSPSTAPKGYSLCVEVIGSGIQADGVTSVDGKDVPAVEEAWSNDKVKVTVSGGKLSATDKPVQGAEGSGEAGN